MGGGVEASASTAKLKEEDEKPESEHVYVNVFDWKEVKELEFYRAVVAEFMATQFFVAFSIGGILSTEVLFAGSPVAIHIWIILFHMVLILIVIYAFGHLSGAHFNPATSITLLFTRRITIVRCGFYVIAQLVGSIAGAGIMYAAINEESRGELTCVELAKHVSIGEGIAMEFFITFGLMFGIFATAFDPRGWGKLGPVAIALIIGLNIHVGSFVTGAAMNPARVFGPAVIQNCWKHQYVYWVGDLVGAVGGGCVYQYLFMFRKHARTTVPSTAGDNHYHFRLRRFHLE